MFISDEFGSYFFFFFSSRRRHTRYWRDWSSDVCSSDLLGGESYVLDGATDGRGAFVQDHLRYLYAVPGEGLDVDGSRYEEGDRKSVVVGKECRSRWSPYH